MQSGVTLFPILMLSPTWSILFSPYSVRKKFLKVKLKRNLRFLNSLKYYEFRFTMKLVAKSHVVIKNKKSVETENKKDINLISKLYILWKKASSKGMSGVSNILAIF